MQSGVRSLSKVVVIRPDDKLGETLLATPVYRALREVLPQAYIEAWVGRRWRFTVAGSRRFDTCVGVSYRPKALEHLRLLLRLRRLRPDALLILRPDTRRYAALGRWAQVPLRAGLIQHRCSLERLLNVVAAPPSNAHQVEWNLSVAEALLQRPLPRYPLEYSPLVEVPTPLPQVPPRSYAVLHLSTGGVQPKWLPERFAQVSDWLAETHQLLPIISAAPQEHTFAYQVIASARRSVINLAGRLTIEQLAAILRNARLLISVDTGIVHLAASVGTPCVSLHFRKDYPPQRWHAWQVPNRVVVPLSYCVDCCSERCRLASLTCVHNIHAEQVIEAISELLAMQ